MIEISHLRKEYPSATPLQDVTATVHDGDIISVIGPSGTGKSTLLRCLNLLDKPTSGQIFLDGRDITAKGVNISEVRKKMGMVFQSYNLFGHLTVLENVMRAPVDLLGLDRQTAYDRAMALLRKVGMEDRALHYPHMLSGGQMQRTAIARTLAMEPDIILFDEPTSALDPTLIGEVQTVIRDLAGTGKTMMIVSHEMTFAREISNRVFYMDQGGIYESGSPEQIFDHPQRELTRRFVRHLKVYEAEIESPGFDFPGAVYELGKYAYRNRIHARTTYRIQTVFEELCQQILLPKLGAAPRISFTVEYSPVTESADIVLHYNGGLFDPRSSENELAVALLTSMSEDFSHLPCDAEPYTNTVTFRVG